MIICKYCGFELNKNQFYCPNCGNQTISKPQNFEEPYKISDDVFNFEKTSKDAKPGKFKALLKKRKKLLIILSCVMVLIVLVSLINPTDGSDKVSTDKFTEGLAFNLDGDIYIVSSYSGTEDKIILPSTYEGKAVKKIASNAFMGNKKITEIKIPDSFTVIEEQSFSGCSFLKKIKIGTGITVIPNNCFKNCTSLKDVDMSNYIETIGENAFLGCESLDKINLPISLQCIGKTAFSGCLQLTEIEIPKSVKAMGANVFLNCITLKIKCKAVTASTNWSTDWNSNENPVRWNCDEYDTLSYNYLAKAAATQLLEALLLNPDSARYNEKTILANDGYGKFIIKIDVSAQNSLGGWVRDVYYICIYNLATKSSTFEYNNASYISNAEDSTLASFKTLNNFNQT